MRGVLGALERLVVGLAAALALYGARFINTHTGAPLSIIRLTLPLQTLQAAGSSSCMHTTLLLSPSSKRPDKPDTTSLS
jgi:hypothetical protein